VTSGIKHYFYSEASSCFPLKLLIAPECLHEHTLYQYNCIPSRQKSVCLVSELRADRPRNCVSVWSVGKKFISSLKALDWLSAEPKLLFNWYPGLFAWEKRGRGIKLTNRPCLLPRLGLSAPIAVYLPSTWRRGVKGGICTLHHLLSAHIPGNRTERNTFWFNL